MADVDTIIALHQASLSGNRDEMLAILQERYGKLSLETGRRLGKRALALLDSNKHVADAILEHLARYLPAALRSVHKELIARRHFRPPILYLGAEAANRNALIERLNLMSHHRADQSRSLINSLLLALAWIGDEVVQQQFHAWHERPPVWRDLLYIPPESYAMEAGWTLTEDGTRRDLFYPQCYELVPAEQPVSPQPASPVRVVAPHEDDCPWCGEELTVVFNLDLRSPELDFLSPAGERLRLTTCWNCVAFSVIYTDVDSAGKSVWSTLNMKPDGWEEIDEEPPQTSLLVLGPARRTAYEAYMLHPGGSQVGGHPTWEQDAEYPRCPGCGQLMTFLAQLQRWDLGEPAEGTLYAFLCAQCRLAATSFQCT